MTQKQQKLAPTLGAEKPEKTSSGSGPPHQPDLGQNQKKIQQNPADLLPKSSLPYLRNTRIYSAIPQHARPSPADPFKEGAGCRG